MSNIELSKVLSQLWKDAPEEEKKIHIDLEAKLRAIYKRDIADFREKAKRQVEDMQKHREQLPRDVMLNRKQNVGSSFIDEEGETTLNFAVRHGLVQSHEVPAQYMVSQADQQRFPTVDVGGSISTATATFAERRNTTPYWPYAGPNLLYLPAHHYPYLGFGTPQHECELAGLRVPLICMS